MSEGHVYIAKNSYLPGMYKVGMTVSGVENRIKALAVKASIPGRYIKVASFETVATRHLEQYIHGEMDAYRVDDSKEFYYFDFDEMAIKEVKRHILSFGQKYRPPVVYLDRAKLRELSIEERCKYAGLENLQELSDLSGESIKTLNEWSDSYHQRFKLVLQGAVVDKIERVNSSSKEINKPAKRSRKESAYFCNYCTRFVGEQEYSESIVFGNQCKNCQKDQEILSSLGATPEACGVER